MKSIKIFFALALLVMMMNSCKKNSTTTGGKSNFGVRMTDAPGNYQAVYIDIQSVTVTGDNGVDVMLPTIPGIYNLLAFSNGVDTLIATGNLNVASVEQIRLILGPNNSVLVDDVSYPLSTPSAEQSGLKLQIHKELQAGVSYSVLLDFDANQSIHQLGNGTYQLHPVIRTIESAISGALKGSVSPVGAGVIITATSGTISYSTVTQLNGEFMLKGLPSGVYNITLAPSFPLPAVFVNNVTIQTGETTNIGVVSL